MPYGTNYIRSSTLVNRTDRVRLNGTNNYVTLEQQYVEPVTLGYEVRSGSNTVYPVGTIINGKKLLEVPVLRSVKVGWKLVPRRLFHWITLPDGRKAKRFYIKHKQVANRVQLVKYIKKWVSVEEKPSSKVYLPPNPLTFTTQRWGDRVIDALLSPKEVEVTLYNQYLNSLVDQVSTVKLQGPMIETFEHPDSPWNGQRVGSIGYSMPSDYNFGSVSQKTWDEVDNASLFKLYTKITDDYPNYVTMIAEVDEMRDTIRDIIKVGLKLVKSLKKLDIARLAQDIRGVKPKDISDAWLAYQYGVAPVIIDIEKTVLLASREAREWRTFKASESKVQYSWSDPSPSNRGRFSRFPRHGELKATSKYGVTIHIRRQLFGKVTQFLASSGFTTPAASVWELIPFSFMLDRIIPLADYLRSASILDTSVTLGAWNTHVSRETYEASLGPEINFGYGSKTQATKSQLLGLNLTVVRSKIPYLPAMPQPHVVSELSDFWSIKRAINDLALFITLKG